MRKRFRGTGGIDWKDVRRRLASAAALLERSLRPDADRVRAVLDERARELARSAGPAAPRTGALDFVRFSLGGASYAIESRYVREVLRERLVTPLPVAVGALVGAASLRGAVVPVADLRRALGGRGEARADGGDLLVLGRERAELAVAVDGVIPAEDVAPEALAPLSSGEAAGTPFVRGIAAGGLVVLDGAALLDDPAFFASANESRSDAARRAGTAETDRGSP